LEPPAPQFFVQTTPARAGFLASPCSEFYAFIVSSEIIMLALHLPPEIESRLDALAKRTGRSKSYYAREAIVEYLDDREDIDVAARELEAVRSGGAKTTPLSELLARYGLAD
jgi:RHH-type transcriptional regulator, rel operon repressor / antitoxin RelB